MQPFSSAPHHDILLLLVQIACLLTCARLLGEMCVRAGQPAVLGELGAGILLGPSLLGGFIPAVGEHLIPSTATQGYLLEVVSMLGAIFLLLITGLETDLTLIRHHLRTAMGVSAGGIVCTLLSGFALGMVLPDEFLGNPDRRIVFALFMATAMSISAIPVVAKVLMDLKLLRRDVGQTILAAGMSDDTIGWILLSVVTSLAGGAAFSWLSLGSSVGKVVLFLIVSFSLGRWVVKRTLEVTQDQMQSRDRLVTLVVAFAFAFGAFALSLGLEAVLGAFVAGIVFATLPRLPQEVPHFFESVALGIFSPIFFAVAGLKVDVRALMEPRLLGYTLAVIAVASVGKLVGTYLGARLIGRRDHWTALSFGAALNARGAMEIIIATIGLRLQILNSTTFSIIVIMAMATSMMAPTALRFTLARVTPSEEEKLRLEREEQAARSTLPRIHRILIPVRYRPDQDLSARLEARVYGFLSQENSYSLTLLVVVVGPGRKEEARAWLEGLSQHFEKGEKVLRVVESDEPAQAIIEESQKDYQLVILGATETAPNSEKIFSSVIDEVVRFSACTTVVLRGGESYPKTSFEHILVPTNGSQASRRAAELAILMASGGRGYVEFLHIVAHGGRIDHDGADLRVDLERAHSVLSELVELGEMQEVYCGCNTRISENPSNTIVRAAARSRTDLVILGTDLRPGESLFLGPVVERVLRHSQVPVMVVNK